MGGETSKIAKMAEYVSEELFSWFRWKRVELPDQNFDCCKTERHAKDKPNHTHPVDCVFYYQDPYLNNKVVLLNTDLKSYAKGSIDATRIFEALKSLSKTIDCARASEEWINRYNLFGDKPHEVRGMLFVYNHDNEYDGDFHDLLTAPIKRRKGAKDQPVKLETLPLEDGQLIHVFEPKLISYLTTIITDTQRLHSQGKFPEKQYEFFYPELRLHKTSGKGIERPATAELLAGPYLIIQHDEVRKYNESSNQVETTFPKGYIVYYNRPGETAEEFIYLLDILSGYQILEGEHSLRIRLTNATETPDPRSNFLRAVNMYASEWQFDSHKTQRLKSIEFEVINLYQYSFSRTVIGWDRA